MRAKLLLLILCVSCAIGFSQNRKIDSLKHLIGLNKVDTNLSKLYIKISNAFTNDNKYDSSLRYFDKAYTLSVKLNYPKGILEALHGKSKIYLESLNQWDSVYKYGEDIKKAGIKFKDPRILWRGHMVVGGSYLSRTDYGEALKHYMEALSVAEKNQYLNGIAGAHKLIGVCYVNMQNHEGGLKEYNLASDLYEQLGDTNMMIGMLYVKGIVYGNMGNIKMAMDCQIKRINFFESRGDLFSAAEGYNEMAASYSAILQPEKALENAMRAYGIFKKLKSREPLGTSCSKIINSLMTLNRPNDALAFVKELEVIANETGDQFLLLSAYTGYHQYYAKMNQMDKAYAYLIKTADLAGKIYNQTSTRQMAEMSKKYETEKKDKELLQKDNEIKIQEAESKSKSVQRNFFVVGFALMIALSFFILRGYQQKKRANAEITKQKHLVDEKQKEILDSIHYAKRIQTALLASKEFVDRYIPNNFMYFNPKDIVSGDFYWATYRNDKFYLAVCDSTGHGVPGAFMSLLSIGFLAEAINEKGIYEPGDIFNYSRKRLIESIGRDGQKDGFDGILMCFDLKKGNDLSKADITYAAANNCPALLSKGNNMQQLFDKMPVGVGEKQDTFKTYTLDVKKGDMLFCYTDGYADQFGGPKGKKFKYKKLEDLLMANLTKPLAEQGVELEKEFIAWKGSLEQVDDVCIIGIRV